MNRLYYGDCLTIMQREMDPDSVDFVLPSEIRATL